MERFTNLHVILYRSHADLLWFQFQQMCCTSCQSSTQVCSLYSLITCHHNSMYLINNHHAPPLERLAVETEVFKSACCSGRGLELVPGSSQLLSLQLHGHLKDWLREWERGISFTIKNTAHYLEAKPLVASIVRNTSQKSVYQGWEIGSMAECLAITCTLHSALGWASKPRDPVLFVLGIQRELAAELMEGYRAFLRLSHR